MKRKWWLAILALGICLFGMISCDKEGQKPWYGTYSCGYGEVEIVIDKDYVTTQGQYAYTVNGDVLESSAFNKNGVFFNDYNVLSFQTYYYTVEVGQIPVESGYFSANLINFSQKAHYVFNADGTYQYILEDATSYSEVGRYQLKDNVLKLDGKLVVSGQPIVQYCLVKNDGYTLDCMVYVKNADSYFKVEEGDENGTLNNTPHVHSYSEEWKTTTATHWKECICGEKKDTQSHTYDIKNGDDTRYWGECICGARANVQEKLSFIKSEDKTYYCVRAAKGDVSGDIVIPQTYDNLPVTTIVRAGFMGCDQITSIYIPNSISSIGEGAFKELSRLRNITVEEDSPYFISQDGVLYDRKKMEILYVPSGVTGSVVILDGVTTIDMGKFLGRYNLARLTIPNSVTDIDIEGGDKVFYCPRLMEIVNKSALPITEDSTDFGWLAKKVKQVIKSEAESKIILQDDYLFYEDNGVYTLQGYFGFEEELVLPRDIHGNSYSIGTNAFVGNEYTPNPEYYVGNSNLVSVVIPNGAIFIGERAFYRCRALKKVEIPDSVTSIGNSAFYGCNSLTSITIPDSVISIGNGAFRGCSNLRTIIIPKSVVEMGQWVFNSNTKIYIEAEYLPDGWDIDWAGYDVHANNITWGYKGEPIEGGDL